MKTKSKLREETTNILGDLFVATHKGKSIEDLPDNVDAMDFVEANEQLLKAFSEELDELEGKAIKGYWTRQDAELAIAIRSTKAVPLSAIKEMKERIK